MLAMNNTNDQQYVMIIRLQVSVVPQVAVKSVPLPSMQSPEVWSIYRPLQNR